MWVLLLVFLVLLLLLLVVLTTPRGKRLPQPGGALPILGHAQVLGDVPELTRSLGRMGREVGGDSYELTVVGTRFLVLTNCSSCPASANCGATRTSERQAWARRPRFKKQWRAHRRDPES